MSVMSEISRQYRKFKRRSVTPSLIVLDGEHAALLANEIVNSGWAPENSPLAHAVSLANNKRIVDIIDGASVHGVKVLVVDNYIEVK